MAAFLLHRPRRHDMNQMEIFKNPEFGTIRELFTLCTMGCMP